MFWAGNKKEIVTNEFLEKFYPNHIHIENIEPKIHFDDPDETEIRLRMYLLVFALKFFIHGHGQELMLSHLFVPWN